ncbi:MAG: hypothetical protein ABSA72_03035 [Nitrososphaerales archaeon]
MGAKIVIEVIAYEFVIGLVTLSDVATPAAPVMKAVGVEVRVGRLAFGVPACTGAASGTRKSIPDSASNASIVPELNLLKYIVDVFIIFEGGRLKSVYKESGRIVYKSDDSRGKGGLLGPKYP